MQDLPDGFDLDHLEVFLKAIEKNSPAAFDGVAIDGGAHRGVWARRMAEVFEEVHAFEARRETFLRLVDDVPDNVRCHNFALFHKDGLRVSNEFHGGNTGASHVVEAEEGETRTVALDKFNLGALAKKKPGVTFLKLDIEGAEIYALKGASKLIKRWRPAIMLELNGNGQRFFGISDDFIFGYMGGLGYRMEAKCNKDYLFLHNGI